MENMLMTADEVAAELKVSKAYAYKLIRRMNSEMKEKGYYTISGKVNRRYFRSKIDYNEGRGQDASIQG